jgi:hypothetical protein
VLKRILAWVLAAISFFAGLFVFFLINSGDEGTHTSPLAYLLLILLFGYPIALVFIVAWKSDKKWKE